MPPSPTSPATASAPPRAASEPRAIAWLLAALGLGAALAAPAVAVFLLLRGLGLVYAGESVDFLGTRWFPTEGHYGVLPLLLGTLGTAGLGLGFAVPLGLFAAIWVRYGRNRRRARAFEALLGVMAGTPSVVFGLFGTFWILPRYGASLLSAGLVLALMIVPSFALFALAALRQVPDGLLRDGQALGLTHGRAIAFLVLPTARPGLLCAATLALARALGEALAVEMVAGNVPNLPTHLLQPVRTLTATLVQEFEYAHGRHADALHLVALLVVVLASLLVTLAFRLGRGRIHATPEAA